MIYYYQYLIYERSTVTKDKINKLEADYNKLLKIDSERAKNSGIKEKIKGLYKKIFIRGYFTKQTV